MGTLCKNCPFKGVKITEGSCTELFAKKYHNSCVTYDISKHQFLKELKEEKPKRARKESSKKASTKKVKKEITEKIKSETNDENTVTD